MTKTELREATRNLAAHLLDIASTECAHHGCNDFDLSNFLTYEQQVAFVKAYGEVNGDPEETPHRLKLLPSFPDNCAMFLCAELLRYSRTDEIQELIVELKKKR